MSKTIKLKLENPKVTFIDLGNGAFETSTTSISSKYIYEVNGIDYEIAKIDSMPYVLLICSDSFVDKDRFYCFDTSLDRQMLDQDVSTEHYISLVHQYEDGEEFKDFN